MTDLLVGTPPHFKLWFSNVKANEHEDRYLAWLTPNALHIWKQPKGSTAGFCGKGSNQHIVFHGPMGRDLLTDPTEVEAYLLKKARLQGPRVRRAP